MRLLELLRETAATAWAARVASTLVCAVVAGMCFVSVATVGRSASAAADVAARLEQAGARTLRVVDPSSLGIINNSTVKAIEELETVDSVHALAVPFDTVNGAIGAGGARVPTWAVLGDLGSGATLVQGRSPEPGEALISMETLRQLRLEHPVGYLTSVDGIEQFPIVGTFEAGTSLAMLDRGAVVNRPASGAAQELVVVIDDTAAADATVQAVLAILSPPPSADIRVQSPTSLARTARSLEADLAQQGRSLLLLILGIGGVLVAAVVLGQVMIRRRDLGRRRTLGASRIDLLALVVGHCVIVAALGAAAGTSAAWWLNRLLGHPTPALFGVGVAVLGLIAASVAALPPAVVASRLDPVTVMRVP